jgi:hypothetical protein
MVVCVYSLILVISAFAQNISSPLTKGAPFPVVLVWILRRGSRYQPRMMGTKEGSSQAPVEVVRREAELQAMRLGLRWIYGARNSQVSS